MSEARHSIDLLSGHAKRLGRGYPWVFSNEIRMDAAAKAIPAGSLVRLRDPAGAPQACATFNPHSLITARVFSPDAEAVIDRRFIGDRLRAAAALRERLYGSRYCRLAHAEADGLPGLVIDRYADVIVCQVNTAGMERLLPELIAALDEHFAPRAVVLRADGRVRAFEGLASYVRIAAGALDGTVEIEEGGARFPVDPIGGQKTGWFFDQRDNRAFIAGLAEGRRVLDLFSYSGGFGIRALAAGAREAVFVDASEAGLALAAKAATLNGLSGKCRFQRADVFDDLARRGGESFDLVVADPPAFVASRKGLKPGLRGYRKLTRLAAARVAPGGVFFIASCSHHVTPADFSEAVLRGLKDAGRRGRVLRASGATGDHPQHLALPETAYLKCLTMQLD